MPDFGQTFSPIAAKEHQCEWCYGPIPRFEKHKHFTGMFESEWQNWRMHDECYESALKDNYLHDGFTPGDGEMPARVKALVEARRANA
jgi:hypothetical protein